MHLVYIGNISPISLGFEAYFYQFIYYFLGIIRTAVIDNGDLNPICP